MTTVQTSRLQVTDPARRRYWLAFWVGVITGIIGGIVKFGWEVPFPPRTPERNVTNPPQEFLEKFGFSNDFVHSTISINGNDVQWVSILLHFGFSICFAVIYCVLVEKYPQIKLWQGVAYGLFIWVAWHIVILPAMNCTPAPWDIPFGEHASEITGHAAWMWVIELTRRDLRNRISHEPDPEVALEAVPR